eukprot:1165634-Amphidinium_carterae.2
MCEQHGVGGVPPAALHIKLSACKFFHASRFVLLQWLTSKSEQDSTGRLSLDIYITVGGDATMRGDDSQGARRDFPAKSLHPPWISRQCQACESTDRFVPRGRTRLMDRSRHA